MEQEERRKKEQERRRKQNEERVGRIEKKRKREEELDDQPVRHSLWEQGSLEAYNELLFGYLDEEVEALQQR